MAADVQGQGGRAVAAGDQREPVRNQRPGRLQGRLPACSVFGVEGVDYEADVNPDVKIDNLVDMT